MSNSKKKVVAYKCLPTKSPFLITAVAGLLLDRFSAVQWVWGAAGLFLLLLWLAYICERVNEEPIDVFVEAVRK